MFRLKDNLCWSPDGNRAEYSQPSQADHSLSTFDIYTDARLTTREQKIQAMVAGGKSPLYFRCNAYLDVCHKIFLDVLLELWGHEGLLGPGPHLGVGDEEGEHLGHVGHQALQQCERHGEKQGPGTNLGEIRIIVFYLRSFNKVMMCDVTDIEAEVLRVKSLYVKRELSAADIDIKAK